MKKNIAALFFFTAFATPAFATDNGFYGALDVGQTKAGDACSTSGLPAGTTVTGCKDTATLYRIAGGYQFAPMWGTEISYGDYGKATLGTVNNFPGVGTFTGDWKLSGLQVSGTGTFPLGNAFSLIGKLGIARTDLKLTGTGGGASVSLSATSTKLAYGIGAQYDFTKSIAVRAQYEGLGTVGDTNTTGTAKVSLLSAGIVFKF